MFLSTFSIISFADGFWAFNEMHIIKNGRNIFLMILIL